MIVKVNSDCSTLISINEEMFYNGDPHGKDKRFAVAFDCNATYHKGLAPFNITKQFIKKLDLTLKEKCSIRRFSNLTTYDAMWAYIYERASQYGIADPAMKIPEEEFIRRLKVANGFTD